MADKTIWDYPTLATADPNDLILMASDEETYNMKVETLKNAMGEAASKPPVIRNGYWYVWSAAQEDYVNTGTAATGPRGAKGDKGDTGDVTPAAQQAVADAQNAASNAASSASSASASQQAAARSAEEAESAVSDALPKANVYNGLDKTASGFALDARQGKVLNEAIQGKQSTLTFDSTPTANSTNPVTSGGVKTALNAKLDSANVYNALDKTASGFALDARQGKALNDSLAATQDSLAVTQSSIAIIVNGNKATTTITEGQYVYIKNSTILSEGLYTAKSNVPSGTTVSTTYFSAVSGGGLNAIQQSIVWEDITSDCTFSVSIIQSGMYRAFVWLNRMQKLVYFVLSPVPNVRNQALLFTLPNYLTPAFSQGYCGIGQSQSSVSVGVRLDGLKVYSSHGTVANVENVGYVGLIPLAQ